MKKLMLGACVLPFVACVATQTDIRVLQGDISLLRTEQASADSARRIQLDRALAGLRTANDSINALSSRLTRFRADVTTSMSSTEQQLLQIQELTGQSQRRLQEVRESLENHGATTTMPAASQGDSAGAPAGPRPGPNQLFQAGREQMMQGSNVAARQAFTDLLKTYPKSDVAADAQFYIAETFAAENNLSAADSVYARVASEYPNSPRAATATYKRAVTAQNAGDTARARELFNTVVRKFPRSDEASLARDRVKTLK